MYVFEPIAAIDAIAISVAADVIITFPDSSLVLYQISYMFDSLCTAFKILGASISVLILALR